MKTVKRVMWNILNNVPLFLMQFVGIPLIILLIVGEKVDGRRKVLQDEKV